MHGVDGWELADYDWDPTTGMARCTYEREPGKRTPDRRADPERAKTPQTMELIRPQPANRRHAGWTSDPDVRAYIEEDRDFPVRRY